MVDRTGAPSIASVMVGLGPDRSDILRSRAAGPLRLLHPRAAGRAAWIVTSSLGGGLVDGDDVELVVDIAAGATALITTQSSTKIYRGSSRQRLVVNAHGDATAVIVPDPVVPYRDARFAQATTITLEAGGSLIYTDILTAGRVAYGERWSATHLDSSLALTIDGTSHLIDRIVLDPAHGAVVERMRAIEAIGTILLVGPRVAEVAAQRLAGLGETRDHAVVVAGSALADGAVIRVAGAPVELVTHTVRELVRAACTRVGEDPWSRKW